MKNLSFAVLVLIGQVSANTKKTAARVIYADDFADAGEYHTKS
jgi:hypothetical protein